MVPPGFGSFKGTFFVAYMEKNKYFKTVQPNINFAEKENEILEYWKKNGIFEKSVASCPEDKKWTFLDGPPFITGLPHYGSLLSSIPKDVFPRYKTMNGFKVRRVWGWDCHGLPAENKVEDKLKIRRKKDIETKIGVKKFIDECKSYVGEVSGEWEWYIDHVARWVDFKNAYKTMDRSYMESVMWVFRNMYDRGYIYKGLRVSLYCPHCSTPISNFEVAMDTDNYKSVTENATTYKYKMVDEADTYFLAWSTTPWNKIATPALAVNPKLTYIKVKQGDEFYILAESTKSMLKQDIPYKMVKKYSGSDLLGKKFVPHYNFYKIDKNKNAFIIIGGDFVTADEGTGIVTIAAYGEEDLKVMQENNIQIVMHVDEEGRLKPDVPNWAGKYYLDVNPLVNQDLSERGLVYEDKKLTHTVPTCWRCHTRLIFAPQNAWYVDVQKLKPQMLKTNEKINWFPDHFKHGRFAKSIESAPDWCISRSRYWGSPVPVWECGCGERFVPGSISELEKRAGIKITDLHKPDIDNVVVKCQKCGQNAHRVPEVLDSWIEAGSAYFGERHFPFEPDQKSDQYDPPDFIVEYTGQIRAWFYVLHVIANALYGSHAFKNVVVTGVILGTDGRKMSKNYGNYPDPKGLITQHGGDALRLYLMGSPVMHGEDIRISEVDYRNQVKNYLLIIYNVYNFFVTYASADSWQPADKSVKPVSALDSWITSRLNTTIKEIIVSGYDAYDTPKTVSLLQKFLNDLSLWYVRRIRNRVGPNTTNIDDKNLAYQTLWNTLVVFSQISAPITPFISENMYMNLTKEKSVHLSKWPDFHQELIDADLESDMGAAMEVASRIHSLRKINNVKVRIPVIKLSYKGPKEFPPELLTIIQDETNVRQMIWAGMEKTYSLIGELNNSNLDLVEGMARELFRQIQILRKAGKCDINDQVSITIPVSFQQLPSEKLEKVKKDAMVKFSVWGEKFSILTD